MIIGVRGTTVWSEDLNRLLPFYRDRLGLPVAIDSPGFVVLGRSDAHALALGTHSDVHGPNTAPARHMVGFISDDIRADWKRLTDAGVVFVEDPKDYGNVSVATFKDPDGNLLQLLQFHRP
jgi:catechol 2,3-dioxygenase-like lactoylglutathione lyase family enzyme